MKVFGLFHSQSGVVYCLGLVGFVANLSLLFSFSFACKDYDTDKLAYARSISATNHLSLVTSPSHLSTDPELASIREEQIKNGRRAVPNPVSFEEWVRGKTSKTKAKSGETENGEKSGWNRVSIWGLITGKS